MNGRRLLPIMLVLAAYAIMLPANGVVDVYVTPLNATVGEKFIVFAKITDPYSMAVLNPSSSVVAYYEWATKQMTPINKKYAAYPGTSNYWTTADDFAAGMPGYIGVSATYIDSVSGLEINESSSASINLGTLALAMTNTNFNLTKRPGESIYLEGYMMDAYGNTYGPGYSNNIKYVVYNLSMDVIQGETAFSSCGPQFCANYILTGASPAGIISIYATNGTDYGGKNIFFAAIPIKVMPSISDLHPAVGDYVELALNTNNVYGSISGVDANLTFPNGTKTSISLTKENWYVYSFTAPNMSGNYILSAKVNHTILGMTNYSSTFSIHAAYLDAGAGKATYARKENVTVTATVYDSNGTAISANMSAIINAPGGTITAVADDGMAASANTKSFNYSVGQGAPAGVYGITVYAIDNFWRAHYKEFSFNVNPEDTPLIASPPSIKAMLQSTAGNVTYTINLTSNSSANISEINVSLSPLILPYVVANATGIHVPLTSGATTAFVVEIIPNTSLSGAIGGFIEVDFDGNSISIPVTITNGLAPSFEILPAQSLEVIAGKKSTMQIAINNNGTAEMAGMNLIPDETMSAYISNAGAPEIIPPGGTSYAYFDINVPAKGTYNGNVILSANGTETVSVALSIYAFDDISPYIGALSELRISLGTRILTLKANGNDMRDFDGKIINLQEGTSDLQSMYSNGRYSEAKAKLAELQLSAGEIQAGLDSIEYSESPSTNRTQDTYRSDGICEAGEPCSSTDCIGDERCTIDSGGSSAKIIIIAVMFVIAIVLVIATSIMPDEKKQKPVPV